MKEQGQTSSKVSKGKLDSCYAYCLEEHLLEILIEKYMANQISP